LIKEIRYIQGQFEKERFLNFNALLPSCDIRKIENTDVTEEDFKGLYIHRQSLLEIIEPKDLLDKTITNKVLEK